MTPLFVGFLIILLVLGIGAIGVPVGFSMLAVGLGGMIITVDWNFAINNLAAVPYSITSQYAFVVVPMFILMGSFAAHSNLTKELYNAANATLGRFKGGLYYATVLASAGFGAVSGSTVVSGAVFTRIALPEMVAHGYKKTISAGCIAAAGTFAALIPPSLSMIIIGILTGESIGRLLIAGLIPGAITAIVYIAAIRGLIVFWPELAPKKIKKHTGKDVLDAYGRLAPTALLVIVVLGGMYGGYVAPSAAGTLGAIGALIIALARRKLTRKGFYSAIEETVSLTATLFTIIVGGMLFSRLLLAIGFIGAFTDIVASPALGVVGFMAIIVLMYLVLGCFIDTVTMLVVTVPFVYPSLQPLGLNPIWFAVIIVKLVEIAAITPPVGLNLFAVMGASNKTITATDIYKGIGPFIAIELCVLAMLIAFPAITLWLPNMM